MTPTNTSTLIEALKPCPFCGAHAVETAHGFAVHHIAGCFLSLNGIGSVYASYSLNKEWNTRQHSEGKPASKPIFGLPDSPDIGEYLQEVCEGKPAVEQQVDELSLVNRLREKVDKIAYHSSQFLMHEKGGVTAGICNRLAQEAEDIIAAMEVREATKRESPTPQPAVDEESLIPDIVDLIADTLPSSAREVVQEYRAEIQDAFRPYLSKPAVEAKGVDGDKLKLARQRLDWLVADCGDEQHRWALDYLVSQAQPNPQVSEEVVGQAKEALYWVNWLFEQVEFKPLLKGAWGDPEVIFGKVKAALAALQEHGA